MHTKIKLSTLNEQYVIVEMKVKKRLSKQEKNKKKGRRKKKQKQKGEYDHAGEQNRAIHQVLGVFCSVRIPKLWRKKNIHMCAKIRLSTMKGQNVNIKIKKGLKKN